MADPVQYHQELLDRVRARASLNDRTGDPLLVGLTLERLLTDPRLGAFTPSPVQRALIRAVDGRHIGNELTDEQMRFHFGTDELSRQDPRTPPRRPGSVVLRTGVRAGKSLIAAIALLLSILTCRFRRPALEGEIVDQDGKVGVRPGELVRGLIVAPLYKHSRAPFRHLVGTMEASPTLARLLVKRGVESCVIRRPDGREVLVEMVSSSAAGSNIRATWLAGLILDEGDFYDGEDAAVNLTDQYRAAVARMLEGSQIWTPSSPWDDSGPFNDMFTSAFGRPDRTLSFHSNSRAMNPNLGREEEEEERRRDPDNAAREYDAIPFTSNSPKWFPPSVMECAFNHSRPLLLQPLVGVQHYAGTDLGFRKNSSALAIARQVGRKVALAYYEELIPPKGAHLKPSSVCEAFAARCAEYESPIVYGDYYYSDTAIEEFGKRKGRDGTPIFYSEWAPSPEHIAEAFTEFRRLIVEGLIDLPHDARLAAQMRATERRSSGGKIFVKLPKQGNAHADLLIAVVIACVSVRLTDQEGRYHASVVEDVVDPGHRFGDQRGY